MRAAHRSADSIDRAVADLGRRARALLTVVDAYDGNTYRLLRDLGDLLGLSLAYVDRETVEAHLERRLSDDHWVAIAGQFTALDFDDHVGDHGSFRTDWIESILEKAGLPGYGYTDDSLDRRPQQRQPRRRRGISEVDRQAMTTRARSLHVIAEQAPS